MKNTIIALLCLCSVQLIAQNNSISIGLSSYDFKDERKGLSEFYEIINLNYKRKISDELSINASYAMQFYDYFRPGPINESIMVLEEFKFDKEYIGKIKQRTAFRFFDLSLSYNTQWFERHQFSFTFGPTYANCMNVILDDVDIFEIEPGKFHIANYKDHTERKGYYGALFGLGYDYYILKNKLNLGCKLSTRIYMGDLPQNTQLGLHLGFWF